MLATLIVILRLVGLLCRGHRSVALENLAELSSRTFWTSAREFSPFQFGQARSREGDWIRRGWGPLPGRRGQVLS
jgi:hypothetical protein